LRRVIRHSVAILAHGRRPRRLQPATQLVSCPQAFMERTRPEADDWRTALAERIVLAFALNSDAYHCLTTRTMSGVALHCITRSPMPVRLTSPKCCWVQPSRGVTVTNRDDELSVGLRRGWVPAGNLAERKAAECTGA
jgi:hypothetical protein